MRDYGFLVKICGLGVRGECPFLLLVHPSLGVILLTAGDLYHIARSQSSVDLRSPIPRRSKSFVLTETEDWKTKTKRRFKSKRDEVGTSTTRKQLTKQATRPNSSNSISRSPKITQGGTSYEIEIRQETTNGSV